MNFKTQLREFWPVRIESLLLAAPILSYLILELFYSVFFIDPYFGVPSTIVLSNNMFVIHIAIFLLPYLMHRFLRSSSNNQNKACYLHIFFSLFLLITTFLTYRVVSPAYAFHAPLLLNYPPNNMAMDVTSSTYIALGLQLTLQLSFIIYALHRIFPIASKNTITSYS